MNTSYRVFYSSLSEEVIILILQMLSEDLQKESHFPKAILGTYDSTQAEAHLTPKLGLDIPPTLTTGSLAYH